MADVDLGTGTAVGQGYTTGALSYHYAWVSRQVLPAGRMWGFLTAIGGFLYYIGGQTSTSDTGAAANVYRYDPSLNTWTTTTSLAQARTKAFAGVINGLVYLAGGQQSSSVSHNTTITYDVATGTQTSRATFPVLSSGYGPSDAYDGRLYAPFPSQRMYYYDAALNTWTITSPSESGNGGSAGGAFGADNKFHVFGGSSSLTAHRVYDPVADSWSSGTAIPSPGVQASPGVVNKGGLLYVMGGRNASADIATVRTFDPLTNTWATKPDLPAARASIGNGIVADSTGIWVAGGASGSSGQTSLYLLRQPEVDLGAVAAIGEGILEAAGLLDGQAIGEGTAEADLQVQWSGKRMYAGSMVPVQGQRLVDYWTERSPIR